MKIFQAVLVAHFLFVFIPTSLYGRYAGIVITVPGLQLV